MNSSRFGELEVIVRAPEGAPRVDTPLLFIHGAYTAAWCWDEHFLAYFARRGFTCYAVSLSGHGQSRRHKPLDSFSINDYVNDVRDVIEQLPTPPVLIGHSMGGMVVQKYLEQATAPGAVLLCSVPPQGLLGSALGLMFSKPGLLADLNRIMGGGQPDLDTVRDALFHQPIDMQLLIRYAHTAQPESHRAIWDMTLFNLPHPSHMHRPPMLVLGAEHDRLIPPSQVHMTATTYGTNAEILPGLGHGIMLEQGWDKAATRIAEWLDTLDIPSSES
ncbi:MAG: alpha/beta fold hydrolase [Rhodocyclaceae bacterium]|jgi:non-heme chloroperoxidase|nr:alpha/beta fold hydrolase [Rhodocyclaceae bacterium]